MNEINKNLNNKDKKPNKDESNQIIMRLLQSVLKKESFLKELFIKKDTIKTILENWS